MKHRFAGAFLLCAVLAGLAGPSTASSPTASTPTAGTDWISVTSALVNKLGGVSLIGQVSCAGAFAQLEADALEGSNAETGEWGTIPYDEANDDVIMFANVDVYTVSQSAGRKAMIQVSHGSSILTPCFATTSTFGGYPVACAASGAPCRWITTAGGYDHDLYGPYFDYSPSGRFKTGLMNVLATPYPRLDVVVIKDGIATWYGNDQGFNVLFNAPVTAVNYR